MMALKDDHTMTIKDISSFCNMSISDVSIILAKLKNKGKLKRVGAGKNGHWEIV